MLLKFAMACILVVACFLIGRSMTASMSRRVKLIHEMITSLKLLQIRMTGRYEPIAIALANTGTTLFTSVAGNISDRCCPSDAWIQTIEKACKRGGQADCLNRQEIQVLDELFRIIGNSGVAQQNIAIQTCIDQLENIVQSASKHLAETSKLYSSLCVLLGLSMAVLII